MPALSRSAPRHGSAQQVTQHLYGRPTASLLGYPLRHAHAYDPTKPLSYWSRRRIALSQRRASSWMNCAVTSSEHGATLRPKASARARAKLVENDRNCLEFLAVLDATFAAPVKVQDVRGLFRQLRMRADDATVMLCLRSWSLRSTRAKTGSDLAKSQDGLLGLIKLYFECFGDKACCFEDLKPYTVLEGSALNAYLVGHTHVSDTESTLRQCALSRTSARTPRRSRSAVRYFEVLSNYQLRGQPKFDAQTLMRNSSGLGWLSEFLRIYILVFLLASNIDETVEEKPLIRDSPKGAELSEVTADELTLFDYVSALCDWLGSYHDHALPQPEAILVEGAPKANGSPSPRTNRQKRHAEEPPVVRDPPEGVPEVFDSMAARFKEVSGENRLPWEVLRIATLTQEVRSTIISVSAIEDFVFCIITWAALTLVLAAGVFGLIRVPFVALPKAHGEHEREAHAFVDAWKHIQEFAKFEHYSLMDVAKRLGDARKRN
ncbi:hypothetical protein DFH11DRAFT_1736646 [Phellopilus nigrolimitatus]|nr:hypothetical protein DFH11DRAFT_1736646 [Phellopilus nigrolimitatus]